MDEAKRRQLELRAAKSEILAYIHAREEEEKRKRNTAIVNDIFDKDLKSLLINNWENPNILPLLLQIKNVQYLEEQHKKESGK